MWQQHQQQKTPLCNSNQRQFSFDWHKGLSSSSLRDATKGKQSVPFLSSFNYGDGFTFTSRQRWRPFISLLLLSALMFVLAGLFLPLVLLRPHKFCLFFTMGSMLSMASFAVLRGPLEQCKHMFSMARCARARLPMCTQRRRRSQQQQKQRQQQQRQRQQQQHSSSRACSSSGPSSPAAQPCSAAQQRSSAAAQLPSCPAAQQPRVAGVCAQTASPCAFAACRSPVPSRRVHAGCRSRARTLARCCLRSTRLWCCRATCLSSSSRCCRPARSCGTCSRTSQGEHLF
jgi:hypothetical protein